MAAHTSTCGRSSHHSTSTSRNSASAMTVRNPRHPVCHSSTGLAPSAALLTASQPRHRCGHGLSSHHRRNSQQRPSGACSSNRNPSTAATAAAAAPPARAAMSLNRGGLASVSVPGTSSRARVAVDVDEVLGRFVYTLNQFCKDNYTMEYDVSDYWIYEFAKIWGCDQQRSNHIVHEFFKSQHFNDGIPVIPGALEALVRLQDTCDLVVVTSRQHVIQDTTLDWIDRHYPGIFQEVYFGNHFAMEGISRKKSDICKAIGAKVLIDDNPSYAIECAAAGIHVLLYDWEDTYPWSKMPAGMNSELITVVRNWDDVERAMVALSPKLLQ